MSADSSPTESRRGIGLRRLTLALLTLSFVTISWNGVYIGGFQPGDLILAPTAAAAVIYACQARQGFRIPTGLLAGAALIGLAGVLSALFPPTQQYLNSRYGAPTLGVVAPSGDLTQLLKFEIALVVIVVIVALLHPTLAERQRLANAWAISALISASVAITDAAHITHISQTILGYVDASGRQSGLSEQENHLALALLLAAPVIVGWLARPSTRAKLAGACALAVLTDGMLLSGSRGGFVVLLFGLGLASLLAPGLRRIGRWVAIGLPLVLVGIYVVDASLFTAIAAESRLAGGLGAESDYARSLLQNQALLDFQSSPIDGIGFEYLTSAHEVHLQLLAAGGLIALLGYVVYWLSAVRMGFKATKVDQLLAPLLCASIISFLVINFAENQVADLYLYAPVALLSATPRIATLRVSRRRTYAPGTAWQTEQRAAPLVTDPRPPFTPRRKI